jgi:hypothetical protein
MSGIAKTFDKNNDNKKSLNITKRSQRIAYLGVRFEN